MSSPADSIKNALPTARSSFVSEMPSKRLLENDDVYRFSNHKPRKIVAFRRDYPENCGHKAKIPSGISEMETESTCDVANEKPSTCLDGADIAQNEPFAEVHYSNDANVEAPIAAVPLRSVHPITLGDMDSLDGKLATDGVEDVEVDALDMRPDNKADVHPVNLGYMESSDGKLATDGVEDMDGKPDSMADVAKIEKWVPVVIEAVDPVTPMERPGLSSESGDDDDDEVCILSREQWSEQISIMKRNCDEAKVSIGKTDEKPAHQVAVKTEDNGSSNLMSSQSCDTRLAQLKIDSPDREFVVVSSGVSHSERGMDAEVCKSPTKIEQNEFLEKCTKDDNLANVECKNPGLINLNIIEHDDFQAVKIRETLNLFDEYYVEFSRKSDQVKGKYAHQEAANRLKVENRLLRPEKPFGHIPGIGIGHRFQFRCELSIIGLHNQHMCGIDYVVVDGKKLATSIVHSGRYKNQGRTGDVLIYSGQGGGHSDQKLEKGNLAMVNTFKMGYPVRVTYKSKCLRSATSSSMRKDNCEYVYDGLYYVKSYREDREEQHMVFKFELQRLSDQPRPQQLLECSRKLLSSVAKCVLDDISNGKEEMKIRVVNSLDSDIPSPFSYMAHMVYPIRMEPIQLIGCDCINGCSDLHPCHCVLKNIGKNGGEIPYNEEGAIIMTTPIVHECGPQCKCPPNCMNRVSQRGPKHQLEIFKTEKMGWGLRSRSLIPSGSFICEYVGELLRDNEADERNNDEYLFDIFNDDARKDGFAIDAAIHGNIGRFINHHCSPNLYAQEVLYDHDDRRMPHIMFFATRNIPPLKELTYDYNYKVGKVCDESGNIKMKYCNCDSRVCRGRLY